MPVVGKPHIASFLGPKLLGYIKSYFKLSRYIIQGKLGI